MLWASENTFHEFALELFLLYIYGDLNSVLNTFISNPLTREIIFCAKVTYVTL